MYWSSSSADNRAAALAKATVTAYDASGAEVEGVVHVGTAQIVEKDGECFISWPEMGLLDTSRRAVGMSDKQQKLSAKQLQGNRGATGWFTLKVAVPGCADLWLLDEAGERAKIVIKNERNAALGWEKNSEGPYGDHSRCVPSHIAPDGASTTTCFVSLTREPLSVSGVGCREASVPARRWLCAARPASADGSLRALLICSDSQSDSAVWGGPMLNREEAVFEGMCEYKRRWRGGGVQQNKNTEAGNRLTKTDRHNTKTQKHTAK